MNSLPDPVRAAFHAEQGEATPLGAAWDFGLRVRQTVIIPVVDSDNAAFSARVREHINAEGLHVVRPIRSTDGRFVVSGWRASAYISGEPAAGRVDEVAVAALRLADALVDVKTPDYLRIPVTRRWTDKQIFTVADKAAWSENPGEILAHGFDADAKASRAMEFALRLAGRIAPLVPPIDAPDQIGHADMLATTIFAGAQPPVVTDIVAVAHPHAYTAAQVIVDGLLFDAVDPGVIRRFSHLPDITALLLRSLLYRMYVHAIHPLAENRFEERLSQVADLLISG